MNFRAQIDGISPLEFEVPAESIHNKDPQSFFSVHTTNRTGFSSKIQQVQRPLREAEDVQEIAATAAGATDVRSRLTFGDDAEVGRVALWFCSGSEEMVLQCSMCSETPRRGGAKTLSRVVFGGAVLFLSAVACGLWTNVDGVHDLKISQSPVLPMLSSVSKVDMHCFARLFFSKNKKSCKDESPAL